MNFHNKWGSVITALVTPFENGHIDYDSLDRLLDFQVEGGIKSFVINGTTGESPTLENEEVKSLFHFVRKKLGTQVKLILGTGLNCTKKTILWSQQVEQWGVDGLLVVTPYYNRPPQEGLKAHFRTLNENVNLPLILYNVPSRTGVNLDLDTVVELSHLSHIVGIKEASGDKEFGERIVKNCRKDFVLMSGDDFTCEQLKTVGSQAVISVVSHILPQKMIRIMDHSENQDLMNSDERTKYSELLKCIYAESNPIGIKMALFYMGIIKSPDLRLPLVAMSELARLQLKKSLTNMGLI